MSNREDGFYWIRIISGGPALREEIAEWTGGAWVRTGDEYEIKDERVHVLSQRLVCPVTPPTRTVLAFLGDPDLELKPIGEE